ncbi:MAG: cyclase family protein [Deltaproteobacteria bacterium]|nr:cyclase family protein [Candidatus Zymogenaceae bacterium]
MNVKYIDLSHPLSDGMAAYPGMGHITVEAMYDHEASSPLYDDKAGFFLGRVSLPMNSGTYLDSPFHRYEERRDLAGLPLSMTAGLDGIVLDWDAEKSREVTPDIPREKLSGKAVLVRTGWDRYYGTDTYNKGGPYLSNAFAEFLVDAGAHLVGVDFLNVDNTSGDKARPVHSLLLKNDVLIVENMTNLGGLPEGGFRFFTVPLAIVKGASFPVRAFAEVRV